MFRKYRLLQNQTPVKKTDGTIFIQYSLMRNKDRKIVATKSVPLPKLMDKQYVSSLKQLLINRAER